MTICTLTATTVIATVVTAALFGIVSPSKAFADPAADASARGLGSQVTLDNGGVVQGWTVSDLKLSADAIPYPVLGALWEATATDEAIHGTVIPIVSNLNARAPSGQTYRVLYQVPTPQGVNPATLAQGQKTTGKVYFDVTGDQPNVVVYNDGAQDLAYWVQSQPLQRRSGGAVTSGPASTPAMTGTPATVPPAAGVQPAGAGSPAALPPAGSQGTPIPGGQRTPVPAISPTPAPAAGPATPAPEASPATPAPEASPATPAPEASPPTPAPEASPPTPTPPGAQGIPATPTPAGPPPGAAPVGSPGSVGSPATPTP
jgi:hypothetical protein